MSMKLTSLTLRGLADELEKLEKLGIDVERFRYGNHTVFVQRSESQHDGAVCYVVGITDEKKGNLRSGVMGTGKIDIHDSYGQP